MPRFIKIGADGAQLPADATDWVAVLDNTTGLMWSAQDANNNDVDHDGAEAAVAALNTSKLAGFDDWDMPTVEELFCLADRSHADPAIDTDFFPSCKIDWYWTKIPYASSSALAWIVNFSYGSSNGCPRYSKCRVRACRRVRSPSQ